MEGIVSLFRVAPVKYFCLPPGIKRWGSSTPSPPQGMSREGYPSHGHELGLIRFIRQNGNEKPEWSLKSNRHVSSRERSHSHRGKLEGLVCFVQHCAVVQCAWHSSEGEVHDDSSAVIQEVHLQEDGKKQVAW